VLAVDQDVRIERPASRDNRAVGDERAHRGLPLIIRRAD